MSSTRTDRSTDHQPPARFLAADCRVADLETLVSSRTDIDRYPCADRVVDEVLVYEADELRRTAVSEPGREAVEAELSRALDSGPGALAITGAFADLGPIRRANEVFDEIIAEEEVDGDAAGDHFAAPGANSRVWNALEKLAVRAPDVFVDYYANDMIALASTAWLGPGYQVTSQVNIVRPGGQAQDPHRDYHLGFMADFDAERYPAHAHLLSPVLTLQGAIVHSDMPVESGPTMLLPHSHRWGPGYVGWRRDDVRDLFGQRHVQVPLEIGDALFLNPALLHGAGTNHSEDIHRSANLLQVSSAFGRAMEEVDRTRIVTRIHSTLQARRAAGWSDEALARVIAASAEGYPFPTNLDRDQPVGSLTPTTQADIVATALAEDWSPADLATALDDHARRRRTA